MSSEGPSRVSTASLGSAGSGLPTELNFFFLGHDGIPEEEEQEFFQDERHKCMVELDADGAFVPSPVCAEWRLRERMRTVSVALVLCLNIGVDPPDVVKPVPCARLEAWIDPLALPPQKSLELIGNTLRRHYERWQSRARYKQALDPTVDDVRRLCCSLRRVSKDERVLFHYNGHGVPRPSPNGEIWVFNSTYTQYIPLAIFDLHAWMGRPSIYVFDCSSAGLVVDAFTHLLHDEMQQQQQHHQPQVKGDCIILAACGADETLPVNPDFPADIFTACLTTPILLALRWFASRSVLTNVTADMVDKIPGKPGDRKTPLGELNWIFTAITDTIAWNVLPQQLFQRLFRQDLLVASLFRNFLLADRIMRSANCTPVSVPALPPTHKHPMWQSWDLAAEFCLSQLERFVKNGTKFQHSSFFTEQLQAFEVWLEHASEEHSPPMQLPVVLQVLLSQSHRLRALVLLARFLDKGSWAVNQALSVGIFPYVLKLLQSPANELREVLVFIWAKILAYDPSCQVELVRDNYHEYFLQHLLSPQASMRQCTMSLFVLASMMRRYRSGQEAVTAKIGLIKCLPHMLLSADAALRQWAALCIATMLQQYEEGKRIGVSERLYAHLCQLLCDSVPEVRTSAAHALGALMTPGADVQRQLVELSVGKQLCRLMADGNPMVRRETILALGELIYAQRHAFAALSGRTGLQHIPQHDEPGAAESSNGQSHHTPIRLHHRLQATLQPQSPFSPSTGSMPLSPSLPGLSVPPELLGHPAQASPTLAALPEPSAEQIMANMNSMRLMIWRVVLNMCRDPFPAIARIAQAVRTYVMDLRLPSAPLEAGVSAADDDSSGNMPREVSSPNLRSLQDHASAPYSSPHPVPSPQQQRLERKQHQHGLHRTEHAAIRSLNQLASTLSPGGDSVVEVDRRAADRAWSLPPSSVFEYSMQRHFGASQMGPRISFDSVETILNRNWRALRNEETIQRATRLQREMAQTGRFVSLANGVEENGQRPRSKEEEMDKGSSSGPSPPAGSSSLSLEHAVVSPKQSFDQIAVLNSGFEQVTCLLFHPFENMLVAADNKDKIGVWNYKELERINKFSNDNPRGTRITALRFINERHISLLLTGCDDGVVRLWRNPHAPGEQQLVSAWKAVRGPSRSSRRRASSSRRSESESMAKEADTAPASATKGALGSWLALDWQQSTGRIVASGPTDMIRIWDVNAEMCVVNIGSRESGVTTLCSTKDGNIVYAGYGDGSVSMYDIRMEQSLVSSAKNHRGRIVGLHLQRRGVDGGRLISGDLLGDVIISDARMNDMSLIKITAHQSQSLNALAAHDYAPLIASGSHKQFIKVFDYAGNMLNVIRYHEGFLGQRVAPISTLHFHPYSLLLAAGGLDSFISLHAHSQS